MSSSAYTAYAVLLLVAVISIQWLRKPREKYSHLPLPPGPPRLPVIGSLLSVPKQDPFKHWLKLSQTLGPILYVNIIGTPLIVLNSNEAVQDLLSKRAARYSDRPRLHLLELMENAQPYKTDFILARQYDNGFRLHHRMLASGMTSTCAPQFQSLMMLETAQLLRDLLREPGVAAGKDGSAAAGAADMSSKAIEPHFARMQSSVVFGLLYSMRFDTADDPVLVENADTLHELGDLGRGSPVLQLLPALTCLPNFLSPWAKHAQRIRARETPLATENLATGRKAPGWNLAKQASDIAARNNVPDDDLKYTLYESAVAGMESTPQALLWILVACLLHPEAVRRAQESLDRVVGQSRLPTFADRNDLPYIDALILETLRWRPVAPSGVPHRCAAGDEYKGMRIPAGGLVLANTWGLNREEAVFGMGGRYDVEQHIPERWLEGGTLDGKLRNDLPVAIFGFGRRTCVGKRIAEDGLFIAVARLLWAFTIRATNAKPDPDAISQTALTVSPATFDMHMKPRGDWVKAVVEKQWVELENKQFNVTGRYEGYSDSKTT